MEVQSKKTIGIIGAGAMGWAIAYLLSQLGRAVVRVWDRDPGLIKQARKTRQNLRHSVPEILMPRDVTFLTNLKEAIEGSELVVLAVPSFAVRQVCQQIANSSLPPLLLISKGMEQETSLLPFQVAREVLGEEQKVLHLTGVGYAKEVHLYFSGSKQRRVAEALASDDESLLRKFKGLFETDWLTIAATTDLLGVQLAGALKNVLVIGIGLVEKGARNKELRQRLINQGVQEMITLGRAMGAATATFYGPAGRGDLEFSADPASRNYRLGQDLAEKGLAEVTEGLQKRGVTVEGLHTAQALQPPIQEHGVTLPMVELVHQVVSGEKDPTQAIQELHERIGAS